MAADPNSVSIVRGDLTLPEFLGGALKLYAPILSPMVTAGEGRNYVGLHLDRDACPVIAPSSDPGHEADVHNRVAHVAEHMKALIGRCPPLTGAAREGITFAVWPRRIEVAVSALGNGLRVSRAADRFVHGMLLTPASLSLSTGIDLFGYPAHVQKRMLPGLEDASRQGLDAAIAYMAANQIAISPDEARLAHNWACCFSVFVGGVSLRDRTGLQVIVAEADQALVFVTATRADRVELEGEPLFVCPDMILESIEETLPDLLGYDVSPKGEQIQTPSP